MCWGALRKPGRGHCLLRIWQERHHIVAAGLSLHSARHLFAAGDP